MCNLRRLFYRGQDVAVVGGGNTAVEEALYLSNIAKTVYLVHRRDALRAEKILQDRLLAKENIKPLWNHQLSEVLGDDMGVTGMRIRQNDGAEHDIDLAGVFIAIGHTPNTDIFADQVDMEGGYIQINSGIAGNATATVSRRLRCGRRCRSHLPSGHHQRRLRLYGCAGRRTLLGRARLGIPPEKQID